jgi:DNA primase
MYPELKLSKKYVIEYYIQVAPRILPFLRDRALFRTRYPDGIQVDGFYEKDAPPGTPDWVRTYVKYSKSVDRTPPTSCATTWILCCGSRTSRRWSCTRRCPGSLAGLTEDTLYDVGEALLLPLQA